MARVGTVTTSTGSAGSPTPATFTHVVETQCRLLILKFGATGNSGTPSSVSATYNGVAMTLVPGAAGTNGNSYAGIFYLVNPPTGSHTVSILWLTGAGYVAAAVDILESDLVPSHGNAATATAANATITITSKGGNLVLDCLNNTLSTITSSNQTIEYNLLGVGTACRVAGSHAVGAASVVMSYVSQSAAYVIVGCDVEAGVQGAAVGVTPVLAH